MATTYPEGSLQDMPYQTDSDTCLMFLVRHAATWNNVASPPKIQGQGEDHGLSPQGRDQAQRCAQFLQPENILQAFCSPFAQAVETASIIARPHQLTPTTIDALREVNVGRWEGKTWVDIKHEDPQSYYDFVTNPAEHGYAGGENLTQVQQRVIPAVEQLLAEHTGQIILVVGHNVVNRVLLATLLHVPLALARGVDQDNCGVNVIRYRDGKMKVLTCNVAFHLQ